MRVIVLGVGGIGAMAAWQLAQAGQEVIALEQFRFDHDRGSSYGDSRIVRRVYADPLYTALMADAYPLWDELQAQFPHQELFRPVGGLFFGPENSPQVRQAQDALSLAGVAHEVLSSAECRRRFPAFALRPEEVAIYEPSMGYARASLCVRAAVQLARQHGADIREETPVVSINWPAQGVQVATAGGERLEADRLIVCAGAWTGPLSALLGLTLPLQVTRQPYIHLQPLRRAADFEVGRFPVWIDAGANTYGFPRLGDVPGVKIASHDHGSITTPDTVNREVTEEDRATIYRYASERFPDLVDTCVSPCYEKVCLYTNTVNEDFILDHLPYSGSGHEEATVWLVSGCSGHGFKFTPLLGKIVADLATGGSYARDLSRFRLSNFIT
jgi:monomeric sarcosine oxidase